MVIGNALYVISILLKALYVNEKKKKKPHIKAQH